MDVQDRHDAAELLLAVYGSRQPVPPLTETYPALDLEDAYAIQQLQVDAWTAAGRVLQGHKVGLTSAAMQRQMQVDQPDYGVLRDDMFYVEHAPIDLAAFVAPRVEPEIAFVLRRDLSGPGVTLAAAAAAVDFVLPALEIIDSRIRDWRISIGDTIADNASSGGLVLGSRPVRLGDVDLRLAGCNLFGNGDLAATGAGGAVLGSPLVSLAWLANTVGAHGVSLRAGQVVLPGSVTAAEPVAAGDTWTATFGGVGTVTARFERNTA
ncbi:MAG: 2-keto-4-pentenoate hydratase [Mycobacteriales bacterium]